jgi:cell pole-organizing protein PopZ
MSSNERAPEPTMEEIIASIRRIISEDEAGGTPQGATPAPEAEARAEAEPDGDADTQMIDDIARVLSGAGTPSGGAGASRPTGQAASPPEEDDVLDLMDLGEAIPGTVEVAEYEVKETVVETTGPAAGPDFTAAFPSESPSVFEPEAPVSEHEHEPEPEPSAPPPPAPPEPEESPVEVKPAAYASPPDRGMLQDPTASFERALAALKAGDLNAFAREVETPAAPAARPTPSRPAASDFGRLPEPEDFPAPAADEPPATSFGEAAMAPPEPAPITEPSAPASASSWRSRLGLPELQTRTRSNGGHKLHGLESAAGGKTLEDSVKEMLRPMLQKWLDENMSRVLTQALREELEKSPQLRRGD